MSKFYLIGAGPGDRDLLTVKADRILRNADVILYDRLIGEQFLLDVIEKTECIYVGKKEGEQNKIQHEIFELFKLFFAQNKVVVRLKGGDPFVFARGVEEWLFLLEHGQDVEVIPGISSALYLPAKAGIPLTAREVSRSFAVMTGHSPRENEKLLRTYRDAETLIILMGVANRVQIASTLIKLGKSANTPAAFIENGCSPMERVVVTTLSEISKGKTEVSNPAVFIVGEVVNFRQKLLDLKMSFNPRDFESGISQQIQH